MAKVKELNIPGPLDRQQLLRAWERARSQPTFIDPFPQEVKFRAAYKGGWIPSLAGVAAVAATKYLDVEATLDPARMSPEVMGAMLGVMLPLVPTTGRAIANTFGIDCAFKLPGREDAPGDTKNAHLALWIVEGQVYFQFGAGDFTLGRTRKENLRIYAAERRYNEELLGRVIAAARLPVRLVPAGKSFAVEHTAGGELRNVFEPEEYGTSNVSCTVPGASPQDLARRFREALAVLHPLTPPKYSCQLVAQSWRQEADPCQGIYDVLQGQRWPVTASGLGTRFRVESPEALDGLRASLLGPRKTIRLELARFKPVGPSGRTPVIKLIVRTRQDGHQLSLLLPPDHGALRAPLERALGVVFQE